MTEENYDEIIPEDEDAGGSNLSAVLKDEKPTPKNKTFSVETIEEIKSKLDSIISTSKGLHGNCLHINIDEVTKLAREIKEIIK